MRKTYKSTMILSFPVNTGNGEKRVTFEPCGTGGIYCGVFSTCRADIQNGIEATHYFQRGIITLYSEELLQSTVSTKYARAKRRKK